MTVRHFTLFVIVGSMLCSTAWSQRRPGASSEVLATLDGVEYTVKDLERMRSHLPPQLAPQIAQMSHRNFLGLMRNLMGVAKTAEKEGLLEKEPYKTQFNFMRWNALANAYTNELNRSLVVDEQELMDYYIENQAIYSAVRVSGIYINYVPASGGAASPNGEERLSEEQAQAKADKLVAELRGKADFAALAEEHSDDTASAKKGGDLGLFSGDSPLPPAIKNAVLRLSVGQISDPVKDGGRFYIFKATDRRPRPLPEVREEIETKLRGLKLVQATQAAQTSLTLDFTDSPRLDERPNAGPGGLLSGPGGQ